MEVVSFSSTLYQADTFGVFVLLEGNAENFTIGPLDTALRIGVPFSIPMQMTDSYGHPTKPPPNLKPVLECR